jgi:1,4-dihydroxy-2-naphthoate octaprenyltransferase
MSLTGGLTEQAVLASIIPLCLVSNLLLLNQYPDIDADRASGRYHLLIAYGRHTGAKVYTLFNAVMIAGMVLLIQTVETDLFGLLVAGAVSIAAIGLSILVLNNAGNQTRLNQLMGPNVALTLATPTMLSILMMWS